MKAIIFFLISLTSALFLPKLGFLEIAYMAPFLVILFQEVPYFIALWVCLFSGFLLDLFSPLPFGTLAVAHFLTCVLLYRYKTLLRGFLHFFIFTYLIGITLRALLPLILLFTQEASINWARALKEALLFPFYDLAYALILFSIPLNLLANKHLFSIFKKGSR